MIDSLFKDRRTSNLLNRVRDDIANLREDIGSLFVHTTKNTVPNSARDLAEQARSQFSAGSAYAANRFRNLRNQPAREAAPWIGGAIVVGLLAFGAYALIRANCPCNQDGCDDGELDDFKSDEGEA